ncbi:DUF2933 domain-containing protein [Candidatus Woesearchaeota archaeon]|nr:DUF2933 domain-containing protein [Candidatus Woesearchaeota archaeon]
MMKLINKAKELINKIKNNHMLMMVICCALPLIVLLIAVRYMGLSNSYLYWFVLLLCPLSHFFMMKHMHKGNNKKGGGCH